MRIKITFKNTPPEKSDEDAMLQGIAALGVALVEESRAANTITYTADTDKYVACGDLCREWLDNDGPLTGFALTASH
jgi:hypothetical protein